MSPKPAEGYHRTGLNGYGGLSLSVYTHASGRAPQTNRKPAIESAVLTTHKPLHILVKHDGDKVALLTHEPNGGMSVKVHPDAKGSLRHGKNKFIGPGGH